MPPQKGSKNRTNGSAAMTASAVARERVLEESGIIQEAGEPRRAVVREFGGVNVGQELTIDLAARGGDAGNGPVLCGVEVVVFTIGQER